MKNQYRYFYKHLKKLPAYEMLFWMIIRQAIKDKDYEFYSCLDYLGKIFGIKERIIDRIKQKWFKS